MYYALSKYPLPTAFAAGAAVRVSVGLSFDRAVGIAMHSGVPPIDRVVMR
jgi:hypothetical protein